MKKLDQDLLRLPTVTVCVISYQHGDYIEQALQSIVGQITNFTFEILVHDDASSDESPKIILEYQKKYPALVFAMLPSENQTQQGKNVLFDILLPKAKGQYIAVLEGDDFWCDTHKLQRQYDALKGNETYVACIHKTKCILSDGTWTGGEIPEIAYTKKVFSGDEIVSFLLESRISVAHTSAILFKNDVFSNLTQAEKEFLCSFGFVADFPLKLLLATKGKFFYLDDALSCYRVFVKNGWTDSCLKNPQKQIEMDRKFICGLNVYNRITNGRYAAMIQDFTEGMQYRIFLLSADYKNILVPQYRRFFKRESTRKQVCILLGIISPHLATKIIKSLKR